MKHAVEEPSPELFAEAEKLTYIVAPSEIPGHWEALCLEVDVVGTSMVGDDSPFGALGHTIHMVATAIASWRAEGTDPYAHPAPEECWPPDLRKK